MEAITYKQAFTDWDSGLFYQTKKLFEIQKSFWAEKCFDQTFRKRLSEDQKQINQTKLKFSQKISFLLNDRFDDYYDDDTVTLWRLERHYFFDRWDEF